MPVSTLTHLNFTGNARLALEFYQSVFGGHLMIMEHGAQLESQTDGRDTGYVPMAADHPDAGRVAFGMVVAENGFRIAAYDVLGTAGTSPAGNIAAPPGPAAPRARGVTHTEPFFVLLNGDSLDELTPLWNGLSQGGTVIADLGPAPFAPVYGMVTDRFGVTWVFGLTQGG
ncbi:VOC family protein [Amycolatopsis sp. NBRC 101858]|uniref:VOC family protein n=1 Tax=Amycolatopsis sp. NBRC 101858 TaxID=3032200 RepID=UPI0024A5AD87|nr:VOC family protein [Amycolatopsis sp. NBRC 101858]GLY38314.1 VOC family protein [Amycolatopsis sp. NBRC 101858]